MASLADNVARAIKVFDDIKTAIIERGVSVEDNTPVEEYPDKIRDVSLTNYNQGLSDGYSSGEADGRQAQYDEIRDIIQDYGDRKNYSFFLSNINNLYPWYSPKYDIRPNNMYMFFYSIGNIYKYENLDIVEWCENAGVELDTSQCTNFMYAFCRGSRYGVIDPRYGASKDNGVFNKQVFFTNAELHTIDELYVTENMIFNTYTFSGCSSLKNLKITGTIGNSITFYSCPLSKDSILSVFNALSPTVEGMTVTFKKTAVNTAFGINVDDTTTYTDEWKELMASKPNWNIAFANA